MADGLKYSLTVMCQGFPGNMTSILHILSSHRTCLAYSTDGGRRVMEYLGTWEEIRSVLLTRELEALIQGSEQCLIDFLTVTSDAPVTRKDGTGNMNSTRPRLRDA